VKILWRKDYRPRY